MQVRRRRYDRTVLAPGQVLRGQDGYQVGDVIGEGGYAVVYAAASSTSVAVAVKEFVPGSTLSDREKVRDLFVRERDVLWRLRLHPNLPDLIEAFSQDGMHYLVSEFIQGESLRERLRREGPIPAAEVGPLSLQLARALAALHAHGVVHHDVKPDNVVLSTAGLAMLLDLGSARFAATTQDQPQVAFQNSNVPSQEASATEQVAGTDGYMAPELREMVEADRVSSNYALDVFAFGCTVYELLTNCRLRQSEIDARNADTISEVVRQVEKSCPELARPVGRALSLEVESRYASAQQLLAELEQVVPPKPAVRRQHLLFELSAGRDQVERSLTIHNAGGGTLSGSVHSLHPALSFRQPDNACSAEVPLEGNVTALRILAARTGVAAGKDEEGKILVRTPHGEVSVTCQISCAHRQPIALVASPSHATLLVTTETMQQLLVKLRNEGGEKGRVIARCSRPSLVELIPAEAHLPPGSETDFCVRPAIAALRPGVHTVTVSFRSESGESESAVQVTIRVRGTPWHDASHHVPSRKS